MGIAVSIGHSAENVRGAGLVVYTAAVKKDNPELLEAGRLGILAIERARLLGAMMKNYSYPVAVSGTHGKTTTTSMLAHILCGSRLRSNHFGRRRAAVNRRQHAGRGKRIFCDRGV